MVVGLSITNLTFGVGSGCEVTCPIVLSLICIGEHVVVLNRPSEVLTNESIEVLTGSGVEDSCIRNVGVEVGDQTVHRLEVDVSIGIAEVTTHGNQDVVASVMRSHLVGSIVVHLGNLLLSIEGGDIGVDDDWIVSHESFIVPEAIWPAVVVLHGPCEYLSGLSQVVEEGLPNPLQGLSFKTSILVLKVKSGKEPSIKAHFSK